MPKNMLWTELLFSYFPIDKMRFWQQMVARFCLLFLIWLTGLLLHALDGLMMSYMLNLQIYLMLFGVSFTVLFGSYMMQRELRDIIQKFRQMLKLDDLQFQKFSERLERYSYSFLPCFFMAIGFVFFLSDVPSEFQRALAEGFTLHLIWNLSFTFFAQLLVGTAIWWFMSVWLTIFLISRQPLSVKLSPETIEKFRALSMLVLWISTFYFLGLSFSMVVTIAGTPGLSFLEVVVSPLLFFIAIGVAGVLFPFYNIHCTLIKLKKQELSKIEEESEQLLQQSDAVFAKQSRVQLSDLTIAVIAQTTAITARLFSLQVKERHVKAAQEWPIDISFLSKLIGLGLIPIICGVATEILTRYF